MATERPINNEAHGALAAAHRGDMGKEKWLTGEPAEHHMRGGHIRKHAEGDIKGWNINFRKEPKWERRFQSGIVTLLFAFAISLTRTGGWTSNCTWKRAQKGRRAENLFMHWICLKTWLCLIHLTQVAETSQQLLCKIRVVVDHLFPVLPPSYLIYLLLLSKPCLNR